MVVIVDFALSPGEFVLGEAIRAAPDISINLAGTAASPDVPITPYVDVRGDRREVGRFERALAEDSTAADAITLVENRRGSILPGRLEQ